MSTVDTRPGIQPGDSSEAADAEALQYQNARYAIDGAIAWGCQGLNEPKEGHWLAEYWTLGKRLATTQWIPVGERLPPRELDVLVAVGDGVMTGFQINKQFYANVDHSPVHATHWMPLPAAPNDEVKA